MSDSKKVIFIAEVGWKGMREFSLSLLRRGLLVDVIIKGIVNKEVLEIITKPRGLDIKAVSRLFFRIYLFFYLLWNKKTKSIDMVVVSKEQTRAWIKNLGLNTKLLVETTKGYELR